MGTRYPQSMFWSKNKKNRYTPTYPSFPIQISRTYFSDVLVLLCLEAERNATVGLDDGFHHTGMIFISRGFRNITHVDVIE